MLGLAGCHPLSAKKGQIGPRGFRSSAEAGLLDLGVRVKRGRVTACYEGGKVELWGLQHGYSLGGHEGDNGRGNGGLALSEGGTT